MLREAVAVAVVRQVVAQVDTARLKVLQRAALVRQSQFRPVPLLSQLELAARAKLLQVAPLVTTALIQCLALLLPRPGEEAGVPIAGTAQRAALAAAVDSETATAQLAVQGRRGVTAPT